MKYLIISAILSFCTTMLFAQSEYENNISKLRFGFNISANYSLLKARETLPSNSEIKNGFGGKLGLLMDYSVFSNILISPGVEIAFNNCEIETTNNDNLLSIYKIFQVSIDIKKHLIYKIGSGKTLPYMLVGPNIRLPLKNRSTSTTNFKNKADIAIDFGIGIENKVRYFIFSPEIQYSFGLLNINKHPAFQTLNYHNISLVLNFK